MAFKNFVGMQGPAGPEYTGSILLNTETGALDVRLLYDPDVTVQGTVFDTLSSGSNAFVKLATFHTHPAIGGAQASMPDVKGFQIS